MEIGIRQQAQDSSYVVIRALTYYTMKQRGHTLLSPYNRWVVNAMNEHRYQDTKHVTL